MKASKWRTKNTNKEHWTRTLINGNYEEIKTPEHDGRTTSKEQGHEQATTTNNNNKTHTTTNSKGTHPEDWVINIHGVWIHQSKIHELRATNKITNKNKQWKQTALPI